MNGFARGGIRHKTIGFMISSSLTADRWNYCNYYADVTKDAIEEEVAELDNKRNGRVSSKQKIGKGNGDDRFYKKPKKDAKLSGVLSGLINKVG